MVLFFTPGMGFAAPFGVMTVTSAKVWEAPASNWKDLQTQLLEAGYSKLFQMKDVQTVENLWDSGKNVEDLKALILAPEADEAARFLAGNLLLSHHLELEDGLSKKMLAEAFAKALVATKDPQGALVGLAGNAWCYPFEPGPLEMLGQRMLSLGDPAVNALSRLLEDTDPLPYEGSEEATLAEGHQVRVKDVATTIICKIRNFEWEWSEKAIVRDASIGFMRQHLGF